MSYLFKTFKTREDMTLAAVDFITRHLEIILAQKNEAGLLLSGGSSPRPIYEALSHADIAWHDVSVGLVDERWVDPGEAGSNHDFISQSFLQNKAKSAKFLPMKTANKTAALGAADVTALYEDAFHPIDICVMGMGTDGHTASWFPEARDLDVALDIYNKNMVCAQDATGCAIAGKHTERISLTLPAVMSARHIILLIAGDEKRRVFEAAAMKSVKDAPIKALLNAGTKLTIFWGAE